MKFLIVFALCVAAATARFEIPDVAAQEAAEIQQILEMINHPNTDPATAAALEQLLEEFYGPKPQEEETINVGPIIVESEDQYEPISVGPAIIEEPVAPAVPAAESSPLVQIIVNVNSNSAGSPVSVEGAPAVEPTPVEVVDHPEVEPTEVNVVEQPEAEPTEVVVVEEAESVPEPIVVSPVIIPDPGMIIPGILN